MEALYDHICSFLKEENQIDCVNKLKKLLGRDFKFVPDWRKTICTLLPKKPTSSELKVPLNLAVPQKTKKTTPLTKSQPTVLSPDEDSDTDSDEDTLTVKSLAKNLNFPSVSSVSSKPQKSPVKKPLSDSSDSDSDSSDSTVPMKKTPVSSISLKKLPVSKELQPKSLSISTKKQLSKIPNTAANKILDSSSSTDDSDDSEDEKSISKPLAKPLSSVLSKPNLKSPLKKPISDSSDSDSDPSDFNLSIKKSPVVSSSQKKLPKTKEQSQPLTASTPNQLPRNQKPVLNKTVDSSSSSDDSDSDNDSLPTKVAKPSVNSNVTLFPNAKLGVSSATSGKLTAVPSTYSLSDLSSDDEKVSVAQPKKPLPPHKPTTSKSSPVLNSNANKKGLISSQKSAKKLPIKLATNKPSISDSKDLESSSDDDSSTSSEQIPQSQVVKKPQALVTTKSTLPKPVDDSSTDDSSDDETQKQPIPKNSLKKPNTFSQKNIAEAPKNSPKKSVSFLKNSMDSDSDESTSEDDSSNLPMKSHLKESTVKKPQSTFNVQTASMKIMSSDSDESDDSEDGKMPQKPLKSASKNKFVSTATLIDAKPVKESKRKASSEISEHEPPSPSKKFKVAPAVLPSAKPQILSSSDSDDSENEDVMKDGDSFQSFTQKTSQSHTETSQKPLGTVKQKNSNVQNEPFKRVSTDALDKIPELRQVTYTPNQADYGFKAYTSLNKVKGQQYKQEKGKKKRSSYSGGPIDTSVKSFKFNDD